MASDAKSCEGDEKDGRKIVVKEMRRKPWR